MQHDLVRQLRRIALKPLAPIIADRVRKNAPVSREIRGADRTSDLWKAFQPVLGVFVPEMERAVTAGGAECAVDRVEGYVVDAEDVADVALIGWCDAVALEGEIEGGVFVFHVLNRAAALYATDSEAVGLLEARNYSRLPFQRGLYRLVELRRLVEIDDVDIAVCRRYHEHCVFRVHAIYSLLARY